MKNKIPQKSFDSQLHIIRDVHFDVDKYKVGELYVINNALKILDNGELHEIDKTLKDFVDCEPILFQKNKVIGELMKVDEHSLTFKVLVNHPDPRYVAVYSYVHFTLSIDKILEYHIEIERLLTETEAAVYLSMAVLDEAKQSTLDPADPKFNRLLGIVPDRSQFPYTLERTHSYQELQAAYKIDEETAKGCVDFGHLSKDLVEEDPVAEMVKHRDSRYLMSHLKATSQSLPYVLTFINDKGEFDPTPFKDMIGNIKITMRKGTSEIVWYTAKRNIQIVPNTIEIKNRNGTVQMILTKDTFFLMFDKITFEDQQ